MNQSISSLPVSLLCDVTPELTRHAQRRLRMRGLTPEAVEAALEYGREVHTRGVLIYAIGRREIDHHKEHGVDLSSYEGVQVLCSPEDGAVITVYRNRDFRGMRESSRSHGAIRRHAH